MSALRLASLREAFEYSHWANCRILDAAADLSDSQLEHPFDMGVGSLRATLIHLYNGEHVWLQRWQGRTETAWPPEDERVGVAESRERFGATHRTRTDYLATLRDVDLTRTVRYRDSRGRLFDATLGEMLMQVCVHSQHHRAQALNMLRQIGAALPRPGNDYIFMKLEQQQRGETTPPPLDAATLQTFYEYGDWANERLYAAAEPLSDAQLDQPFAMGCGTLRETLLHIRFAEQWWFENWTEGPGKPFPELPATTSIEELRRWMAETAAKRDALLAATNDAGLSRIVSAVPRPGVTRTFPLGATMLQLCLHGVHHRAQAVNMLRRAADTLVELDVMVRVRKEA